MRQSFFILILTLLPLGALALEGLENLETKLFEKNQEFLSLQMQTESKEALSKSTNSAYYPTINAIGGWGQNRTDDLPATQKGYLGYIEGRMNLFRGFKDQAIGNQRDIDLKIARLELESKKRALRLELTDIAGAMISLHKLQGILEEEFKVTQTQRQMAAKKVAAGLTGAVDNVEFDLRETEIQIEQKQIDQQHQETHQTFIKLFGEEIVDSDLEKLDFSSVEILTNSSAQTNIENTLDYRKAELAKLRFELEKTEVKSDFLPSIDFTYGFGRITPSEDSPIKFNESRYALLLTIPLFSGFESFYKTRSANLSTQSAEKLKIQKRNEITSDLSISKTKMSELSALFQINEKKLISSQKYFDLTLSEYKRGIKNSPDLVGATERWFSAKKRKFELLKELEILKVKIENYN